MTRLTRTEVIAAAAGVAALVLAVVDVVDKRNEVATLRAEVASLKIAQDTVRAQNERLFQLAVGVVKDGQLPLQTLQPFLLPAELKQVSQQVAASRKETLPMELDVAYFPSGWMGDGESGERFVRFTRTPMDFGGTTKPVVEIAIRKGPKGWSGIYWQFPDGNWGDQLGRNLVGAKAITFSAKGKLGGEIVEFKSGGIRGKRHSDSFETSLGKVILKPSWSEYRIDLSRQDLSNVVGAFAAIAAAADNPSGNVVFYVADLRIE